MRHQQMAGADGVTNVGDLALLAVNLDRGCPSRAVGPVPRS
jgi:hypothetical protein